MSLGKCIAEAWEVILPGLLQQPDVMPGGKKTSQPWPSLTTWNEKARVWPTGSVSAIVKGGEKQGENKSFHVPPWEAPSFLPHGGFPHGSAKNVSVCLKRTGKASLSFQLCWGELKHCLMYLWL